MDFTNIKCPVCDIEFKDGDDVVVCPECGTPHHRECYEKENRCFYENKHNDGFSFGEESNTDSNGKEADTVICPRCKAENQKGMFYCGKCGYPLSAQNSNTYQNTYQNTNTNTTFPGFMDPMAGVNPEENMGEGVTAGEVSKFVQNNTPYFIRVFNNIKNFNKGRFCFVAFLFSGGYLLYRKMYKIGGIITAIMLLLWTSELYIHYCTPAGQKMIELMNNYYTSVTTAASSTQAVNELMQSISSLDNISIFLLGLMYFCSIAQFALRIIIGIFSNRWYFKHCKTKISAIKKENSDTDKELRAKGGVNTAIALSLFLVYLTIEFVPYFLTGGI